MRICWVTDYEGMGNSFGYSVHNAGTRKALIEAGVTFDEDAPVAVHVSPAHLFNPLPCKANVLFTAWEMEELPPRYVCHMGKADAIVVTASFLVPVVARYLPAMPVRLCHLGVDVRAFRFVERSKPADQPFRFLWVGAPNARKGWEIVLEAFRPFLGDKRFELYLKTTVTGKVRKEGNVIFDSRRMNTVELAALYQSARCFLFPSFGEGFGFTMAEAMATGLPVIYTPWSSLLDLAPLGADCAFPLRFNKVRVQVAPTGGLVRIGASAAPDAITTDIAQADSADLAEQMMNVWKNYGHAVKVGRRAAQRIRAHFTWPLTARRMIQSLEEVERTCQPARNSAA